MGEETIVLAIRGSLIAPEAVDTEFLEGLRTVLERQVEAGRRFVCVCGGGEVARVYQRALASLGCTSTEAQDNVGIRTTKLNARLLIEALNMDGSYAHLNVFNEGDYDSLAAEADAIDFDGYPILAASGWKPGRSIDHCAVTISKTNGIQRIVKLSDIDYIYNRDPDQYSIVKPLGHLDWQKLKALIPDRWEPGAHLPFDSRAIEEAEHTDLSLAVINGHYLDEVERCLDGKSFIGSLVEG